MKCYVQNIGLLFIIIHLPSCFASIEIFKVSLTWKRKEKKYILLRKKNVFNITYVDICSLHNYFRQNMSKLAFINKKLGEQSTIALFFSKCNTTHMTRYMRTWINKVNQISIISLACKLILTHANTLFFLSILQM